MNNAVFEKKCVKTYRDIKLTTIEAKKKILVSEPN